MAQLDLTDEYQPHDFKGSRVHRGMRGGLGLTVRECGVGHTLMLTPADAHALADWIKENIEAPPAPTFRSEFDKLEVGDQFTMNHAHSFNPNNGAKAIKVDADNYYHYGTSVLVTVRPAETSHAGWKLTKN